MDGLFGSARLRHARKGLFGAGVVAVVVVLLAVAVGLLLLFPSLGLGPRPYLYFPGRFFPFEFVFLFLLVFFVARLVFWRGGWGGRYRYYYRGGSWGNGSGAVEVLRLRYARGEINREQFVQMMADLEQHKKTTPS